MSPDHRKNKAVRPESESDWQGTPGKIYRETLNLLGKLAKRNGFDPEYITSIASEWTLHELRGALEAFKTMEESKKKMASEQRKISEAQEDVNLMEIDAQIQKTKLLELLETLKRNGVFAHQSVDGDLALIAAPADLNLDGDEVARQLSQSDTATARVKIKQTPGQYGITTSVAESFQSAQPKPVEIFCSYSHKDETFLRELEDHLSLLKREGLISLWFDRQIFPGATFTNEIEERLNTAEVFVLLISTKFLASNYCYEVEFRRALERHQAGDARVIPIILKSCDWKNSPIGNLQALPKDGKPITKWKDRAEAFTDISLGIRKVVQSLQNSHVRAAKKLQ